MTHLRTWACCAALALTACGGEGGGNGTDDPAALAALKPYGLTAYAINAGVTLDWPRISGALSYNLYWSTKSGGLKTKIANVTPPFEHCSAAPGSSCNLSNGSGYHYTYTVVRAEGESAHSPELPAVPNASTGYANPADPDDCSADAQCDDLIAIAGNGQVQLYWSGLANATSYNVYWKTAHDASYTSVNKITNATSPFILTGRSNDTPYYFVVTAVVGGTESAVSREVVAMPYTPEPLTPLNVVATPGGGQVSLSWDAVTNATSYSLLWSTSAGVTANATRIDNVTSPYVHTGLTNGQTYYYALVSLNDRGPSPLSAEVAVQPSAGGATVNATPAGAAPDAPMHVKAFAGHLQNTINADDDSNAVRYTIYWDTSAGVTIGDASIISDVTLPYTHSGLTDGIRVYYRVVAMNRYGASGLSAEASAAPQDELLGDTVITQITDGALQACINSEAAAYGWSYVRQVDYLYCDQTGATADIVAMTGIDKFPNLVGLHVANDGTAIDASAITLLPNLSALTLRGMQLDAAGVGSVVGPLAHLTYLDLYNNNISVVPALPSSVTQLQLANNQISDVSPLAALTALQELHLSNNVGAGLINVNALATLTQAYWIVLGGNPLMSCSELMALRAALDNSVVIHHLDYPMDPKDPWIPVSFPDPLTASDCT